MIAKMNQTGRGTRHTGDFLKMIGVRELPPCTSPFDPGYDPATLD